jgi:enoyl-CoA hydratase/carnithine racemase
MLGTMNVASLDERILADVHHGIGRITLNRPSAMNALDLGMVRALTDLLLRWQHDEGIAEVRIRGMGKAGPFGSFCAGGDIRFFHAAAMAGNPQLEDFFTEEYSLNHLVYTYGKPYVAFMDGVVMGGGMGLSQGASLRIVTEKTRMAMPETLIGLFPDVAGGYFLSRCPGHFGEFLGLTGAPLGPHDALDMGLADVATHSDALASLWDQVQALGEIQMGLNRQGEGAPLLTQADRINLIFSLNSVGEMVKSLEMMNDSWAEATAALLRKRSPLMLEVTLQQIRKARQLKLADVLRMERDLVRHCFFNHHLQRSGTSSETVEGIRALAIDKDHKPHWNPVMLENVTASTIDAFFQSPWPIPSHPLRHL